jgi:hypothetical protein
MAGGRKSQKKWRRLAAIFAFPPPLPEYLGIRIKLKIVNKIPPD